MKMWIIWGIKDDVKYFYGMYPSIEISTETKNLLEKDETKIFEIEEIVVDKPIEVYNLMKIQLREEEKQ